MLQRALNNPRDLSAHLEDLDKAGSAALSKLQYLVLHNYPERVRTLDDMACVANCLSDEDYTGTRGMQEICLAVSMKLLIRDWATRPTLQFAKPTTSEIIKSWSPYIPGAIVCGGDGIEDV